MTIMIMNKESNEEIVYNNVQSFETHGAIWNEKQPEPVFQLIFEDGSTATFHKSEWDLFILKNVR